MQPNHKRCNNHSSAPACPGKYFAGTSGHRFSAPLRMLIALAMATGLAACSHQTLDAMNRTDDHQVAAVRLRAEKATGQLAAQQYSEAQSPTVSATGDHVKLPAVDKNGFIDRSNYPVSNYLTAIGSGTSRKQAAANAMVEIAKIFQSRIEASSSILEDFRSDSWSGNKPQQKKHISTSSKITTDMAISGIQIAQIVRRANEYLALAVLNRNEAVARLQRKLTDLDTQTDELMADYNRQSDRLLKVRLLKKAQALSGVRQDLASQILVLRPAARLARPPVSLRQIETELTRILLQDFRLAVNISGQGADKIARFLVEALTKRGFAVIMDPSRAQVILEGKISIIPQKQNRSEPWYYVNWTMTLTLIDTANNIAFASSSESGRKGHLSYEKATRQALYYIGNHIVPEMVDEMSRHIFKLAENQ